MAELIELNFQRFRNLRWLVRAWNVPFFRFCPPLFCPPFSAWKVTCEYCYNWGEILAGSEILTTVCIIFNMMTSFLHSVTSFPVAAVHRMWFYISTMHRQNEVKFDMCFLKTRFYTMTTFLVYGEIISSCRSWPDVHEFGHAAKKTALLVLFCHVWYFFGTSKWPVTVTLTSRLSALNNVNLTNSIQFGHAVRKINFLVLFSAWYFCGTFLRAATLTDW